MKHKMKVKKYANGGPSKGSVSRETSYTDMTGKTPQAASSSSKVGNAKIRSVSDNKNYVTKMKTDPSGNITDIKSRRTVKGFMTGAPRVKDNLKRGGVVKKKK